MGDWVIPDRRVVNALRDATARCIGRRYRDWPSIRWNDTNGCLSLYERTKDGSEMHKFDILDEEDMPRQADERDIERYIQLRYGWCEQADRWRQAFEQRKVDRVDARKDALREHSHRAAARIVDVWNRGLPTRVEVRAPAAEAEVDGMRISDSRRFASEAANG